MILMLEYQLHLEAFMVLLAIICNAIVSGIEEYPRGF